MITLWVAAGALSAAAAIIILLRAAGAASTAGSSDPTMDVYRRQLAELEGLADSGLLDATELATAKSEAGRRLLKAADQESAPWASITAHRPWVAGVVAVAGALALIGYLKVGSPTYSDQPIDARIQAWRNSPPQGLTPPELVAVLRAATAENPDTEGLRLLAVVEMQTGNASEAARALRKAITRAPQRSDLWEMLGEVLVSQADGQESEAAQKAFNEALKRDPKAIFARLHLARAKQQAGDTPGAKVIIQTVMADVPPSDPRRPNLDQAVAEILTPQPAITGPAMNGDQMAMIRAMVSGLDAKLKANPDDPEGWVRLVRSYSVLGDATARDAALAEAKSRYRGRADITAQLEAAAKAEALK